MSKKFRALLVALVSAGSLAMGTTIIVAPAAAGGVLQTAHGGDNVTGSQAVHFLDSVQKPRRLGTVTQAVDFHWWGVDHNFGPVGTNRILAALNVGSGLSTLVAILCAGTVVGVPCAFAYGVAAALMTIGGGLIGWCSRNGNGFRVVKPYVGMPYCTGR